MKMVDTLKKRQLIVSKYQIKRWIQNKNNNKNLSRKKRKYESYKVRSIHVKYAIKMLEKEPTITMPNLLNKLKNKIYRL